MLRILLLSALALTGSLACETIPAGTDAPTPPGETAIRATPTATGTTTTKPAATAPASPEATRTKVNTPTHARPTPTPTQDPLDPSYLATQTYRAAVNPTTAGPAVPCDRHPHSRPDHYNLGNMVWHPEGTSIFIISQENIWEAQADGSGVRRILDLNPPLETGGNHDLSRFGFHMDLSPDGSRLVYSSCEYPAARPEEMMIRRYGIPDMPGVENEDLIGYELATINLETMEKQRLTRNNVVDHFPAWSPDGQRVAYLTNSSSPREESRDWFDSGEIHLAVMAPGSNQEPLQHEGWTRLDYLSPPVWSPDGRYIAISSYDHPLPQLGYDGKDIVILHQDQTGLKSTANVLTVQDPGSRTRLGETTAGPAWSPDSARLAFADGQDIYTVNPDGTGLERIWTEENHINHLDWHPDGSEILVSALRLFTITPEGQEVRRLAGPASSEIRRMAGPESSEVRILEGKVDHPRHFERAIWSPDGASLAAVIWQFKEGPYLYHFQVVSISRNGSEVRTLASAASDGGTYISKVVDLVNPNPPRTSNHPHDPGDCDNPRVVAQDAGPNITNDCRALLEIAGHMALNKPLNWGGELPITEWEGIGLGQVNGELRVDSLIIRNRYLGGTLPGSVGKLTGLKFLHLSYEESTYGDSEPKGNLLTGTIPPEIGNLSNLIHLDLMGNNLTGTVPESLNNLLNLTQFNVRFNYLRGCISSHLAGLMPTDMNFRMRDTKPKTPEQAAAQSGLSICTPGEE